MNKEFDKIMEYFPGNRTVFEELSFLCIDKKIVPYIGAGLSQFAGNVPITKDRNLFPGWKELIRIQYHANFSGNKMPDNLINVAQDIEDEIGKNKFYEYIRVTMGGNLTNEEWDEILEDAENHAISFVPKLFFGPIITSNFDRIIENYIEKNVKKLPVVLPDTTNIMRVINSGKQILYKIHGCVSDHKNIVLTSEKYEKAYSIPEKYLTKFFQDFRFLFLGCSLYIENEKKDKPIEIWEDLIKKRDMYHYAILPCNESDFEKRRAELESRKIYPILYEEGKHESVKLILKELLNSCQLLSVSNKDDGVTFENIINRNASLKYNENQKNIAKSILEKSIINFKDKKYG